ncbi:MAG: alpha/beta hydrolase [Candidatus Wallbacteria bacterium HGW-Wallbacteria-1]|uniref:Alpha/beta hydrolase n=1 Tax=Candidatus Wallbacteria bacterium HGW-Wallbacteria-1 TaxID=2013854 RepID=A0A2N1PNE0_9BACT|nr:MAG: alpha/beta hydrolase [Candidatus Wallbacteria bacterium HGW-Wallbacteria-1]
MNRSMPTPVRVSTAKGFIEYLDSGSETDTAPVLCLHGAMGGYDQSWALGETILESGYRTLSLSRPGYPGTPMSSGHSPEEQADLYAALMDTLGINKITVAAISGGGPSAIQFALRHREKCERLILCSTLAEPSKTKIPFSFKIFTILARFPFFTRFMKRNAVNNLNRVMTRSIADEKIRSRTMADEGVMKLFRIVLIGMYDNIDQRLEGTAADIRMSQTFTAPIEEIRVPTLIIHGTDDKVVPFSEHGKKLAQSIPDAVLCSIEGGEHVSIFTHRKMVRAAVRKFMS